MPPTPRAPKVKGSFLWWMPAPPKSPDYSTPEAVTLRAQEAAWTGGCPQNGHEGRCFWTEHVKGCRTLKAAVKSDGKVYRDFKAALIAASAAH